MGNLEKNKQIFDVLYSQRDAIEHEFGATLDWRRLDDKRASRILRIITGEGSLSEPEKWGTLQELMIDAAIKFDKAFRSRL